MPPQMLLSRRLEVSDVAGRTLRCYFLLINFYWILKANIHPHTKGQTTPLLMCSEETTTTTTASKLQQRWIVGKYKRKKKWFVVLILFWRGDQVTGLHVLCGNEVNRVCVSGSHQGYFWFPGGQTPDVREKSITPKVGPLTRGC